MTHPVQWFLRDESDLQSKSCVEESLHEAGRMRSVAYHLHEPIIIHKEALQIPCVYKNNSMYIPMYMLLEVEYSLSL